MVNKYCMQVSELADGCLSFTMVICSITNLSRNRQRKMMEIHIYFLNTLQFVAVQWYLPSEVSSFYSLCTFWKTGENENTTIKRKKKNKNKTKNKKQNSHRKTNPFQLKSWAGHWALLNTDSSHWRIFPINALSHAQVSLCYKVTRSCVCGNRVRGMSSHTSLLARIWEGTQTHTHTSILAKVQGVGRKLAELVSLVALVSCGRGRCGGRGCRGRQGCHGQMTVHHLHGILGGGAVGGRVVESRPWSRCYDLSVMVMMVMGVQCLGMLGRHMKSGFLDWMSLYSDRFWSYDSRPYYWGMIRLSRLHKQGKNQEKKRKKKNPQFSLKAKICN